MRFIPDTHHRQSIRLPGFDYTTPGAYFVTIVTQGRECLFGDVVDGVMCLNELGLMTQKWLLKLPDKFPSVILDELVIMPNHIHVVVWLVGADPCVCPDQHPQTIPGRTHGCAPTLNRIIQWFKTMSTNESIRTAGLSRPGILWQRNYWERILRGDDELNRIRQYIIDNPKNWETDEDNPQHHTV